MRTWSMALIIMLGVSLLAVQFPAKSFKLERGIVKTDADRVLVNDKAIAASASLDVGELPTKPRVGFEILQIKSRHEMIVWLGLDITREEFEALKLPLRWFKNQAREVEPNAGRFAHSPGVTTNGNFTVEEHFGHTWRHVATVIKTGIKMDEKGLLKGNKIEKYHEVTFKAGRTVNMIISPDGERYVRISRDTGRESDQPTIPRTWQQVDTLIEDAWNIPLPNPTLNIRGDNEDSFQGPVTP